MMGLFMAGLSTFRAVGLKFWMTLPALAFKKSDSANAIIRRIVYARIKVWLVKDVQRESWNGLLCRPYKLSQMVIVEKGQTSPAVTKLANAVI